MRIDFKPKNQEEVLAILLFYWAYWWRTIGLSVLVIVPIAVLYFVAYFTLSVSKWVFILILLSTIPLGFFSIIAITLYLFKTLASKQFETFSVRWIMPYPESIFERVYLKNVLSYFGVSTLVELILGISFPFAISFILEIFIFYLFVKNQWLPFIIEAKIEVTN